MSSTLFLNILKLNHLEDITVNGMGMWDSSMNCLAERIEQS
jgi:hypothetical protein